MMASKDIEMTNCVEESELLNGSGSRTSIKMQEAPFSASRTGSEEDMLEYDDEPVINCDACRRRRPCTLVEKTLIGFSVVCLVVILVLAVRLGQKKDPPVPKVCNSKECLRAASSIIGAMDPKANPCEDFHQYACGGWLKETPIPPGYPVWDRFQELSYKNLYMLKNFIESRKMIGTAQGNVKTFYKSCMEESRAQRGTTLNDFKSLLSNISKSGQSFNLQSVLLEAHKISTWPLFQLTVGPDERNPDKNIIKIEAAGSPFPHGIFKPDPKSLEERNANKTEDSETSNNATTDGSSANDNSTTLNKTASSGPGYNVVTTKPTTNSSSTSSPSSTAAPKHIKETHPHPKHNVSELVKKYLEETSAIIRSLWGKTEAEADREAELILGLEKKISLAHDIDLHIHDRSQAFNGITISDLNKKCPMIDWETYLNLIIGSPSHIIPKQQEVIVLHEEGLLKVCDIVKEYMSNATLKSTLRNYILLGVARTLKPYFDMRTFQPDIAADKEIELEGEHWRRCTYYANKAMGLATGAIYVKATSSEMSLKEILNLVNYVKRAFKDYLLRKIWLDQKTKDNAAAKIDAMIEKVSYPSYILNTTFLDDYYKHFSVGSDWFRNILNWRTFVVRNMITNLGEKYDRKQSWINPPVTVESDYSPVRNDIIFPIALFHLPIYSNDGPSAMNFGAMGSVIGHEITHAFDIIGRQYDGHGRLRDWWDPVTADMFNETTGCMRDQYDHYKVGNMTINGEQTLDENIADNGGLRAAHMAYELWLNEHGDEAPLPGVNLNNRQIFYISFAQLYCSKWKDAGIRDFLVSDIHSPGPFRIQGALSNSLAFQQVFQCSYISAYNPSTKCRVW